MGSSFRSVLLETPFIQIFLLKNNCSLAVVYRLVLLKVFSWEKHADSDILISGYPKMTSMTMVEDFGRNGSIYANSRDIQRNTKLLIDHDQARR